MEVFKNEFGDLIHWRVALAGAFATILACGLGVSLVTAVHAVPQREAASSAQETAAQHLGALSDTLASADDDDVTDGAVVADAGSTFEDDAFVPVTTDAALQGQDLLQGLTTDAQVSLVEALKAWADARATIAPYTLTVMGAPQVTPESTRVEVRLATSDEACDLMAELAPGGTWQVSERMVTPTDEMSSATTSTPIPLADTARLSQVMDAPVAAEIWRQMAASGIAGAAEAWTTPESIVVTGTVMELSIWVPQEAGDPVRYEASYDAGMGLLSLEPVLQEGL